ncbi:hypothetical protein [Polyangium fumosum]|uniref:Uncharacterized protein n=1 Tax=Polyangium fumosum TaxID=889272 RepID=A0A4U1JCU7_9BACT|nr:hypothetical protein [Polyangium fumosum]TKD07323.1 hypothetical protein E8A74_17880 [Polyangium fumosum]
MRRTRLAYALVLATLGGAGCGSNPVIEIPPPSASATEYTLGGTVKGLEGKGLVLEVALPDELYSTLTIAADGEFTFKPALEGGDSYDVTVAVAPGDPAQSCTVTRGKGVVAGADVKDVAVDCTTLPPNPRWIGGTVSGLAGTGLVLQNNGKDDLPVVMDGAFQFMTPETDGDTYDVTVSAQPTNPAQTCVVEAGKGTVEGADVTGILVKCTNDPPVFNVDPNTIDVTNADRCDFLDAAHCLFPWPNDHFTVADPTTSTGRRVALHPMSMPVNAEVDLSPAVGAPAGTVVSPGGIGMDPTDWNRADGFSPGQMLLTYVPGLDLGKTGIGPITHMERSLEADSPLVVVDAETLERHLVWGELDSYATSDATRALILRAGMNFREGHRYVVALRNLKDSDGQGIEASDAFQVYRDAIPSDVPAIEARRDAMEKVFDVLAGAGVERKELYLAWEFTVASAKSLAGRMLHIRDDGFEKLGNAAPAFTITQVLQNPDANRSRRITGTFTVPNYLNQANGIAGSSFHYAEPNDGLPDQFDGNGTLQANFICNIPRAALPDGNDPTAAVVPGRAALYGHGQQGAASQVNGGSATGELSNAYNFVFCATDFIGMSTSDNENILRLVTQFGRMNTLADRLQQGLLNNLFLARLMIHPQGFIADPAFRGGPQNQPLIDTSDVFYYGISQGGILGGALVAISQDIRRGVLGVTGMNYSVLLDRATGFDQLRVFFDQAYTNELDRRFVFSSMQMLWDRGETNGYAWHVGNDPLPKTPPHAVLMQNAFADHQVTQWSADIEARTIGAGIHVPVLNPGRSIDTTPYFGIEPLGSYPHFGSAVFVWDTGPFDAMLNKGTPPPPVENKPLRDGVDPHGAPRVQPGARLQISEFLRSTGKVIDPCGETPCLVP